jgi:hypothetical protein
LKKGDDSLTQEIGTFDHPVEKKDLKERRLL